MSAKKILLIEDNPTHAIATVTILNEISPMYQVEQKAFAYNPSVGDTRQTQTDAIVSFISTKLTEAQPFEVLMIDMLLATKTGGDSSSNPIGIEVIKTLSPELNGKLIIAYTQMAIKNAIREYNNSAVNINKIYTVAKPPSFNVDDLNDVRPCIGVEHKKYRCEVTKDCCSPTDSRCTAKEKFLCAMICLHDYSFRGSLYAQI